MRQLLRGEALIRGGRLFQCGYPKVWRLLEGVTFLRSGTYSRKYDNYCKIKLFSSAILHGMSNEPEVHLESSQTSTRDLYCENG